MFHLKVACDIRSAVKHRLLVPSLRVVRSALVYSNSAQPVLPVDVDFSAPKPTVLRLRGEPAGQLDINDFVSQLMVQFLREQGIPSALPYPCHVQHAQPLHPPAHGSRNRRRAEQALRSFASGFCNLYRASTPAPAAKGCERDAALRLVHEAAHAMSARFLLKGLAAGDVSECYMRHYDRLPLFNVPVSAKLAGHFR